MQDLLFLRRRLSAGNDWIERLRPSQECHSPDSRLHQGETPVYGFYSHPYPERSGHPFSSILQVRCRLLKMMLERGSGSGIQPKEIEADVLYSWESFD